MNSWTEKEILLLSKKTSCCIISASKSWTCSTVKTLTADLCCSKTSRLTSRLAGVNNYPRWASWGANQHGHGQWCILALVSTVWAVIGLQGPCETLGVIHCGPPCSLPPSSLSPSSFKCWIIFLLLQEAFSDPCGLGYAPLFYVFINPYAYPLVSLLWS